jgi:magnesium-transporting ATPase (P-type)
MMSVLCSRKQQEIMFSKGALESVMARCTHILCNNDGSSVPLTMDIRNELEARFQRLAFFGAENDKRLYFRKVPWKCNG